MVLMFGFGGRVSYLGEVSGLASIFFGLLLDLGFPI